MPQEKIDEILGRRLHAIVGCNRMHNSPLLSPVWYFYENGRVYFTISRESARYHLLKRDPRITICVESGHPDESYVTIYGTARIVEETTEEIEDITWRGYRRYFDTEREAREAADEISGWMENSATIVVTPEKTIGVDVNRDVWDDVTNEQ
jgi:PPOX class probable F420-dependent enzyme